MKLRTSSAHSEPLAPPACGFPMGAAALEKHDFDGELWLPEKCRERCSPERCPAARLCIALDGRMSLKS